MNVERHGLEDLIGVYLLGSDPAYIENIQGLLNKAGYLG
jgi:hypothetical protein